MTETVNLVSSEEEEDGNMSAGSDALQETLKEEKQTSKGVKAGIVNSAVSGDFVVLHANPEAAVSSVDEPKCQVFQCDNCRKFPLPVRFRCQVCEDFDLCTSCFVGAKPAHDETHMRTMKKIITV